MTPLPKSFLTRPLAHRALHDIHAGRPENSRTAISAAMEAGYGVEIDVQLSADGVAIVFHDDALDRLTHERGWVRARSCEDLAAIPLLGGDEGIPTLSEVLKLVGGAVPVLIEIKDQDGALGKGVGPLETSVAQALARYEGPVAVMSFNPHSVAAFGKLAPEVPRGLVTSAYIASEWAPVPEATCDRLREIPDYDRVGASFISHEVTDLRRSRVAALKQRGATILCWTVTSAAQERMARRVVDGITFEGYAAAIPA